MDKNNKESLFIKKYPLIFKKYRPLIKITNGAFSEIYYGINIQNNRKVAIKTEYRFTLNKLLESESFLLFSLKGIGIPKVLSFGHNKEYDILIMPLLGKSLKELYLSKNSNFEFKDICLMAIQIIERIRWVHSHNIIHRDIKPDNFLIGLEDPNIIYLIDFGLSKKYKSSTTGKHISFTELKKFTGTVCYGSANALRFKEQSRRDDLESICYMIIYLMKGSLPWQKIKVNNKKDSYLKIGQFKKDIKPEKLCENLPGEMIDFVNYVKNLKFEEDPDYNYLKNLFEIMLKKGGYDPHNIYFSWIDEYDVKKLKKPVDYSKRSSNSRERIINKIRNSLDYKRCISDNKNIWKQSTDYNLKIKSYLDEKVLNNIKNYDLSKAYSSVSNENHHINYIKNSMNNNYITISVSISNNNDNINPNLILNKNNTNNAPYLEYDNNSNSNTVFRNSKLKDINKIIGDINYDKVINCNSYNKKSHPIKHLENDKTLYRKNLNYYYNTINNINVNTNIYRQKSNKINCNNNINNLNLNRNNIKEIINNKNIKPINSNSYNLSYFNLKEEKKNNNKKQKNNINLKYLKTKLLNISQIKNLDNNNIQKNNSHSVTNNNKLMREIRKFNLRFNYGNNIKDGIKYQ